MHSLQPSATMVFCCILTHLEVSQSSDMVLLATTCLHTCRKLPYRPVYFAGGAAYGVAAGVLLHVLTSRKAETEA
jgi:hypothetical protein